MMNQQNTILRHLQTHKSGITSKDAIERYGCTRLSAVIKALEKKGHEISHVRETVPTRYGSVSIMRYFMEEPNGFNHKDSKPERTS